MRRAAAALFVAAALVAPATGAAAVGYCTGDVDTNCAYRDRAGQVRVCKVWAFGGCVAH